MTPDQVTRGASLLLLCYLIGSVPFGVLIGRLKGVDPRTVGSGNIGATNVLRALGPWMAASVLILDMVKGLVPVLLVAMWADGLPDLRRVGLLGAGWPPAGYWVNAYQCAAAGSVAGVVAIIGHNWPIFLRFKGGKGVSTSAGVIFALDWRVGLLFVGVFILVLAVTRYVSVASTLAAWAIPAGMWVAHRHDGGGGPLLALGLAAAILVTVKHRANYARLANGTESRFRFQKSLPTDATPAGPA
ncbi:MAG TPA: glycerol-3-phosphate 1-O-acyltransferase PlsY [Armatimonadota bacterium]|jgi:glycerol-3-phosphate acyltransferase PlsY